jgi:hypothetical protein
MARNPNYEKVLDDMWAILETLGPDSTEEELKNFAGLFDKDAKVYFNGMGGPPSVGHEAILETLTGLLNYWKPLERRVTTKAFSEDGMSITAAMDNRMLIVGKELNHVPECEVVAFSKESGLIKLYELFIDPTEITAIMMTPKEWK